MAGGVDGSHDDCRAVLRVSDSPTPAAIGRVPRHVESTADVRVGGKLIERRVFGGEAVGPIRACDVVERASGVVKGGVVRGAEGARRRGGCLRQGVDDLRGEEREGEGDSVDWIDHCESERVGLWV